MSRKASGAETVSGRERWRIGFHQRQLRSLPAKLAAWGQAIDPKLLPDIRPEQFQALVASVQTLVYRLEQFLETDPVYRAKPLSPELRQNVKTWQAAIENIFGAWARKPEAEPVALLRQRLETGLTRLGNQVKEVVNRAGGELSREEGENFFRVLGGYRGISEATLAYAGAAQAIDWTPWREERFS
jgi:hypothetical protein